MNIIPITTIIVLLLYIVLALNYEFVNIFGDFKIFTH
jgi:hypothetical protein